MKRLFIAVLVVTMFAAVASAEQHGGPPSMGAGMGPGMGPGGFGEGPGAGGNVTVGTDGTIYITKVTTAATTSAPAVVSLSAIKSTGATAWTVTLPSGAGRVELSGSNLIADARTRASDGTVTSTLTAISTSTGATAWTTSFTGDAHVLAPFSGGTYVEVVAPPVTQGALPARSLVALDGNGKTLWSISI